MEEGHDEETSVGRGEFVRVADVAHGGQEVEMRQGHGWRVSKRSMESVRGKYEDAPFGRPVVPLV